MERSQHLQRSRSSCAPSPTTGSVANTERRQASPLSLRGGGKMTISRHLTKRGNVIHLVSPSDLVGAVQSGERLRVSCPIHGGDHQRSLSIDLGTGWGFCHSCHATVLVQSHASIIASSQGNRYGQYSAKSGGFGDRASATQ